MTKATLKKLGFSVAVTVLFLLLAEGVVRLAGLGPARYVQSRHLETGDKRHGVDLYPDNPRDAFDLDLRDDLTRARIETLGLDVGEYVARTPHGVDLRYSPELCRGAEIGPKSVERLRVMVIGDSFAEGQGVTESETSSAQLQVRLGEGYEVLNCGRRGYDVSDVREFLESRSHLDPDIVIYAYTLNDPEQSEAFAAGQTYLDDWIMDRRRMVSGDPGGLSAFESHLWATVTERLKMASVGRATTRWYQQMVEAPNAEGWRASVEHVVAMSRDVRERGGHFAVVIQPLLVELDGDYPFEGVHARVMADLSDRDVEVHDALPAFVGLDAPSLWVHPSDRHPNGQAQGVLAEAFEAVVREASVDGAREDEVPEGERPEGDLLDDEMPEDEMPEDDVRSEE